MRNKKINIYIALFILLCTALISCKQTKLDKSLNGSWVVDSIIYKGKDVKACLKANIISFGKKNTCNLLEAEYLCPDLIEKNGKGKYLLKEFDSDSGAITIITSNQFFKGEHQIVIQRDSISYTMHIKSDSIFLICTKI